jgi:RNA polymerase sigma-70 factor (ECF subfamily)
MLMTERSVIEAAQRGDRDAFARLVEQEYVVIFRIAMQWSGVRADAEDIAQQACIKLARSIQQFRFESAFRTWLYRLVINCARDWQQSQQRHHEQRVTGEQAGEILDSRAAAQDDTETLCYLENLMARVDQMGNGFRETLLLVAGEGCSHREAAEVLGVSEGTVSWRIHAVRKHLNDRKASGGGEV